MHNVNGYKYITTEELINLQKKDHEILLLDPLPKYRFEQVHAVGAKNACVYEVTFLDQVAALCKDKNRMIVVCGVDKDTYDATTAASKLIREGYTNIAILEGGLVAWQQAGCPLAGELTVQELQSEKQFTDGRFQIDLESSVIQWAGRNFNTTHWGTLHLSGGEVSVNDGEVLGECTIDMNSIDNINLAGNDLKPVLEDHLKSDDFFFVKKFPEAHFKLHAKPFNDNRNSSSPNYHVKGELTLCGATASQEFDANLVQDENGRLVAEAHFDFDRTRWGVIYGSTRFFKHLGMHLVFDHISLQLRIMTKLNEN
jgi:polyisoprenoid-binding protein YceI